MVIILILQIEIESLGRLSDDQLFIRILILTLGFSDCVKNLPEVVLHVRLQIVDLLFDNIKLFEDLIILGIALKKFGEGSYIAKQREKGVSEFNDVCNCGGNFICRAFDRFG